MTWRNAFICLVLIIAIGLGNYLAGVPSRADAGECQSYGVPWLC